MNTLVAYLSSWEGRKALFFFSNGFALDSLREAMALRLAHEATTAQVTIHPIDSLGLIREKTFSDYLAVFALNTGGVLIHGTNNFAAGLARIEQETRVTYVLAYRPPGKPDGRFHSTVVNVARKGVRIRSQEGFLWLTDEGVQERRILAAHMNPELFDELPFAIEPEFYLTADGGQAVDLALAIPDRSILFLPHGDRNVARLDVGLTFRSALGIMDRFSQRVEIRLPASGARSSEAGPESEDLTLLVQRRIPSGDYEVVAVVSDVESGQVGAVQGRIKVPSLATDRMAASSLILSSPDQRIRRVVLDSGVVRDPRLTIPAVRRTFSRDTEMVGSLFVYHPQREEESGTARVRVKGVIRRGSDIVQEIPSTLYVFTAETSADGIPLKFPVSLTGLEPGPYNLEIQVLDEIASRGISQRGDFTVH
ncbi:MAG TPA: hypothetical protein VFW45_03455 [Candidatus Polarisedimenticolia bacterium]|nr:hypothetical protein [Candidatus Polarisedimenticolia bacterium]